jgi:hypothetical protein
LPARLCDLAQQLACKVEEAPTDNQGGYRGGNGTRGSYPAAAAAGLFTRVEIRDAFTAKEPRAPGAFADGLARLMREAAPAGKADLT